MRKLVGGGGDVMAVFLTDTVRLLLRRVNTHCALSF